LLENLSEILRQCYEHAEECARQAQAVQNKKLRADYLRLEERWLKLARSYELGQRLKLFINETARRKNDLKKIEWRPIYTAPFHRDLELALFYGGELHILDFPCRRIIGGWVNAETKARTSISPTYWRQWPDPRSSAP
jgi:hypothetical protein